MKPTPTNLVLDVMIIVTNRKGKFVMADQTDKRKPPDTITKQDSLFSFSHIND